MKDKIIEHAKTKFSSSPIEYSDEELDLIIEHSCECDDCGESFFEMDDFPDISIENDEVLCEDCYFDKYRDTCIICEESYEKEDVSDYFFITQKNTKTAGIPVGMYKVLKRPFYYGDCITGFDAFFNDSIEKVSNMDINKVYAAHNPRNEKEITADLICPDCAEKYLRKDNFIKAEPVYCLLRNEYRNNLFKNWSYERIHRERQWMIHNRITFRGLLQKFNNNEKRKTD